MILKDLLGREFRYLRLSITEQCNFRCVYCLPYGYQGAARASEFISRNEIRRLAEAFSDFGVEKFRLTGGEPTLRKDFCQIAEDLRNNTNIKTLALSTNGHDLRRKAKDYRQAGITHLNVSLDDVDPKEFHNLRGRDLGEEVMDGIDHALHVGFPWIKVNAVLVKDGGIDRLERFVKWVKEKPISVRFIELMQTENREEFHARNHMSSSVIHRWLIENRWIPQIRMRDAGPAVEYTHSDSLGKIGIIAPYSKGFCDTCNRLRVSCRGELQLCLFGSDKLSLRDLLQRDDDKVALQLRVIEALKIKKPGHSLHEQDAGSNKSFSAIGG